MNAEICLEDVTVDEDEIGKKDDNNDEYVFMDFIRIVK